MKAGDIVKVKVMEVDLQRKRIALTMRLDEQPGEAPARRTSAPSSDNRDNSKRAAPNKPAGRNAAPAGNNAMADALAAALSKKR